MNRTIDVEITFSEEEKPLVLPGVNLPVTYEDLVRRLEQLGHYIPTYFDSKPCYDLKVTSGRSVFELAGGDINIDEPLIQYYHETFCEIMYHDENKKSDNTSWTEARIVGDGQIVVGGIVRIGFQRTIRVPENEKIQALPPDMGHFTLYNTADCANRLPPSISYKGGICIAMYQREAMWISFSPIKPCAVKVSVGGINAITGTPRDVSIPGKQDYLALGDNPTRQLWLDGIATAPGIVRQFVAVPLGKGMTVEGQITGREVEGGIQFDVYPRKLDTVLFLNEISEELHINKTPRQLGLSPGSRIRMEDIRQKRRLEPGRGPYDPPALRCLTNLCLFAGPERRIRSDELIDVIVQFLYGKTINLFGLAYTDSIYIMKCRIQDKEGIPTSQQRLMYAGIMLEEERLLQDYTIQKGSRVHLILRLRGGGGGDITNLGGIGVGGRISQKINKDPFPATAYNHKEVSRLHVTIINASAFSLMTGLPPPPSPVSPSTYLAEGYPWFELYDEHIPTANVESNEIFAEVESVGALLHKVNPESKYNPAPACPSCDTELATISLVPCGHTICDECDLSSAECVECGEISTSRRRFAAPMGVDEESQDGVEAGSQDERIVQLLLNRGTNTVTTFISNTHSISRLTGDGDKYQPGL